MNEGVYKVGSVTDPQGRADKAETNSAPTRGRATARSAFGPAGQAAPMIVCESRLLSDSVLQLSLLRDDGGRIVFKPGQFCSIAIPSKHGPVERSYSIATRTSDSAENRFCEIAVAPVKGGVATQYLFSRRVGDQVRVSGPFGRLVLPAVDPQRYVFIGTGTGVAPYRAMLPELQRRSLRSAIEVALVMGVRTRRELIYADEFRAFAKRHPWFRFITCYSRESTTVLSPFERLGRVQSAYTELDLIPGQDRVYLCGHPLMIDDWTRDLKEAGFDKRDIVREKYVSPKPRRHASKSPPPQKR